MPPKPQPLRDLLPPDLKLHPYPESDRRLRSSNYNHERGGPQSHTYFRSIRLLVALVAQDDALECQALSRSPLLFIEYHYAH